MKTDLALPASTNTDFIVNQLQCLHQVKKEGMTVVFSTYQSIAVIAQAQKELLRRTDNEFGSFDLIICDEAHRTTGVTLKGEDESSFVKVHDNTFLQAKHRIYKTATPRIYVGDTKKKAKENEAVLCSMDDTNIYGEEIYKIGFGEAVEKELLTDYKVLILAVGDKDITPSLRDALTNEGSWLDGNSQDGMRKCLEQEFSTIYIFNLRGNQRTSGELSRKEGGKIFGSGSRTPIAITILVKKPKKDANEKAKIYYHDIGDYLSREDKLNIIKDMGDISNPSMMWRMIKPNEHGDWINKRNEMFKLFTALGDKEKASTLKEQGDEKYILNLLLRIVTLSLKSVEIIESLPKLNLEE